MVRGNWQKRVERAQDRRDQAKTKKIRKGQKALYKALVQNELWPLLDKFKLIDSDSPLDNLHLWVDCKPVSRDNDAEFQDNDDSDSRQSKKKPKQKSKGDATPAIKKAHPRSHENVRDEDGVEDEQLLCHQYFFTGTCGGFAKGGKSRKNAPLCQHCHYLSKKHLTLAGALSLKSLKQKNNSSSISAVHVDDENHKHVLGRASNAAALAQKILDGVDINSDVDIISDAINENVGIDMVHYMKIPIVSTHGEKIDVTDAIMKVFSVEKVNIGAIAYVAYGNVLLFDRFDGGVVISPEAELDIFGGSDEDNEHIINSAAISDGLIHFPGTVLEHVLGYLPGGYAGILPRVCKSLYQEVGTTSPSLWKLLIQRSGWPLPEDPDSDPTTLHKAAFLSHFRICQRVKAFNNGIKNLIENVDSNSIGKNTALSRFQEKQNFPTGNSILCLWNESSVLVASRSDCVLRLFKCYGQNSTDKKSLREVFNLRLAPVPLSKKVECSLESIALDDRYAACSFSVSGKYFVTSITKEDLLSNSTENVIEGNDILQIHDLTKSFLEYYESIDDSQMRDTLVNLDVNGMETVRVKVIDDLKACGNGIFCAIVRISVATDEDEFADEDEDISVGVLSLSLSKERNAVLDFVLLPSSLYDAAASLRISTNYHLKRRTDSTELTCSIPSWESDLFFTVVDRKGKFEEIRVSHQGMFAPTLDESWDLLPNDRESTHTVRTPENIATSYLLQNQDNLTRRVACILYPAHDHTVDSTVLFLERDYESVLSMKCMNRDYLVLVCACGRTENPPIFDGHWFGDDFDRLSNTQGLFHLVIVHVPSKKEIQCTELSLSQAYAGEPKLPRLFDVGNHCTVVGLVEDFGITLSGAALMDSTTFTNETCGETTSKAAKKVKKKKRLTAVKSGKKDGFARGQGLRGG
jgi:hypothetical protein